MSQGPKFQQLWEFRRRDDEIDSSSDDSKSGSGGDPSLKKRKLDSNFILPENNETSDTPISQPNGQLDPGSGVQFKIGGASRKNTGLGKKTKAVKNTGLGKKTKAVKDTGLGKKTKAVKNTGLEKKTKAVKNKKEKGSVKEGNKKKRKLSSTRKPNPLDDLKIFMQSILEELNVERESMFTRMREEMEKLVAVGSASRLTRKEGSCVRQTGQVKHPNSTELDAKTQDCNAVTDSNNNCYKVVDDPVSHDQAVETITSNEKDNGEKLRPSGKKSTYSPSNRLEKIASSSYLTLPSVLPEPRIEQCRIDSSSRNFIQSGGAGNDANVNSERANVMNDASNHHGYFLGIQGEEQFGSFAQMGSKYMGFYDQHSTQTSTMDSGFPVPLHQRLDSSLNIPSQKNSSRGNNILGLKMNGGAVRFSGGSHVLSDHLVANNFHSHMNFKPEGGVKAFGTRELKDGHLYPN